MVYDVKLLQQLLIVLISSVKGESWWASLGKVNVLICVSIPQHIILYHTTVLISEHDLCILKILLELLIVWQLLHKIIVASHLACVILL